MTEQPVFIDGNALILAKRRDRKPFAKLVDQYRLRGVSDVEIMRAMTGSPAMISTNSMVATLNRSATAGGLFGEAISDDPVVGVEVIIPSRQCACEHAVFKTGPGKAMHKAALVCAKCEKHCGWLPAAAHSFLSETIKLFGKPAEPVIIRAPDSGVIRTHAADTTTPMCDNKRNLRK
jgi:hypothetical protein